MNLTPHFTEEELIASEKAKQLGIDNSPSDEVRENLFTLADGLERVRAVLGCAMHISSGYRCPKLNAANKGAKKSAHMQGLAADFTAPDFGDPLAICKAIVAHKDVIGFNRLINEGRWVHVDFPVEGEKAACVILTARFGTDGTTYTKGL